jgi:hypothetical protein
VGHLLAVVKFAAHIVTGVEVREVGLTEVGALDLVAAVVDLDLDTYL